MNQPMIRLAWAATIICFMTACQPNKSEYDKVLAFAERYTAAWNSKIPERMATCYAADGYLVVNSGKPSIGRDEIAATAKSYMEAFPDMKLTMDSLVADDNTYRYHWTFEGTNTGEGGTGNKVVFSGFEQWQMNAEGLVQSSVGTYDAVDYSKQLNSIWPKLNRSASQESALSYKGFTTTESGLHYRIVKEGSGKQAQAGDEIMLRETTMYREGTVLYSNETTHGPVKVLIGGNQATEGVDEGLRGMRQGEIRLIIAAPHLVKRKSYPPNVSPDSTLVIKLILQEIL